MLAVMADGSAPEDLRRETGLALLACDPRDCDIERERLSPEAQLRFIDALLMAGLDSKMRTCSTIGELATNLRHRVQDLWKRQQPCSRNPASGGKKSTEPGEARAKILAALGAHHDPQAGSCLEWEPLGVRQLADKEKVAPSSVTGFFTQEFGDENKKRGHARYKGACKRKDPELPRKLIELIGEPQCHDNYGTEPPAGRRDRHHRSRPNSSDNAT